MTVRWDTILGVPEETMYTNETKKNEWNRQIETEESKFRILLWMFDAADHDILLTRLSTSDGIRNSSLDWLWFIWTVRLWWLPGALTTRPGRHFHLASYRTQFLGIVITYTTRLVWTSSKLLLECGISSILWPCSELINLPSDAHAGVSNYNYN